MKSIHSDAPVVLRKSISISASRQRVWSILADINHWPDWNTTIAEAKLNGDLLPSSTFSWKSGGARILSTLHTVEPYERFGWTGKAPGVRAIHNWMLEETNGHTTVYVEESMEGIFVWMLQKMFKRSLDHSMSLWLEDLKRVCEK